MSLSNKELLYRIKGDVAKENGFKKWTDIVQNVPDDHEFKYWPIVCERYATEKAAEITRKIWNADTDQLFTRSEVQASCEATLKKASENAKWGRQGGTNKRAIIKSSITDPSNIVIL